jgi:hypothetical protein
MSVPPEAPRRRIAVALDASEQSLRVVAIAAGIAALLEAELEGVFIEDAGMLGALGLPFQQEFRLDMRGEAAACPDRLARELRVQARRIEAASQALAAEHGCRWSFRVWRGDLEDEILGAACGAELFTLSRIGRFGPLWPRRAPRRRWPNSGAAWSRAQAAAPQRHEAARPAATEPLTVSLLFDGSGGAARSLAAAGELAVRGRAGVRVIVVGDDAEVVDRRRQQALALLRDSAEQVRFVTVFGDGPQALLDTLLGIGGDIFIIDAGNPLLGDGGLWRSLAALHCPMLVVR